MDHFAQLAATYDILIDWPTRLARERPFFAGLIDGRDKVLDVGCGTGHHCRMFTELGAETLGIDPSAPMLEQAHALTSRDNPRFQAGGLGDIALLGEKFDLITIIGNTLSYVSAAAMLVRTLRSGFKTLAPGGCLVTQTINYDRLLLEGNLRFPLIARQHEGADYLYLREYRLLKKRAEFTVQRLNNASGWSYELERSTHYPIRSTRLATMALRAGFSKVNIYGDYERGEFKAESSGSIIMVAAK